MKQSFFFGDKESLNIIGTVGPLYKQQGNKVIYFVKINSTDEYFEQDWPNIVDEIICYSEKENEISIENGHFVNGKIDDIITNLTKSLQQEKISKFPKLKLLLDHVDSVVIIGQSEFINEMRACKENLAESEVLKDSKYFAYALGPMQCMLKGICGQCLQWQVDPVTKKRTKAVFACSWQCQPMDLIDFSHLAERSKQNVVIEKLQEAWFNSIALNHRY